MTKKFHHGYEFNQQSKGNNEERLREDPKGYLSRPFRKHVSGSRCLLPFTKQVNSIIYGHAESMHHLKSKKND